MPGPVNRFADRHRVGGQGGAEVVEAGRRAYRCRSGEAGLGLERLSDLPAASIGFPAPGSVSGWLALEPVRQCVWP